MERRHFNESERIALYLAAGGKCCRCGRELGPGWHADHVTPWSKDGPTDVINGQALCAECNLRKGASMSFDQPVFDGFRGQAFSMPMGFSPRNWQIENLNKFKRWLADRTVDPEDPRCFLTVAGVGSGKTKAAVLMAAYMLNEGIINRIVYVAPNKAIIRSVEVSFREWGISLARWSNQKHSTGESAMFDGAISTYQSASSQPQIQRALLKKTGKRTAVFFDEIHHLGDDQSWGEKALEAFGPAHVLIGLSGTPFRTDNQLIPFVEYEDLSATLKRYKSNHTFTLGEAVAEGLCRKPVFRWLDGEVSIDRAMSGGSEKHRFTDGAKLTEDTANLMLAGAVAKDSEPRLFNLARVIEECRAEGRKLIIFVGGDSKSDDLASEDATQHLPAQLVSLGVKRSEILAVTCKTPKAHDLIADFGLSEAWILIAVNIVSEGVDIPPLSAALFLTSITAKQTTIQRIGRVLRMRSLDDPIAQALIYMFRDSRYVQYSQEIEDEIMEEIRIRSLRHPNESEPGKQVPQRRTVAIGVGEGGFAGTTYNGKYYSESQLEEAKRWCIAKRYPLSMVYVGLALEILFKGDAA